MKILKNSYILFLLVTSIAILGAGCGTFEVGIESLTTLEPALDTQPPQFDTLPSATPPPPAEIVPTETSSPVPPSPDVPDLVTIGHLAPFAGPDIGLLTLKNGQLTVEPSPVDYGILWGYSPLSGKLAYSSEFFHTSDQNNLSVSDLWVYDYQSGTQEEWLDDNVTRAVWAPDGEHLTAAVYNPESEQIDLVLVSGPNQVELIAECASIDFSWSPDGDMLAYVNAISWLNFGVQETCLGTYLVTFPNGITGEDWDLQRVSDFGTQEFGGKHISDMLLWDLERNALIYPDQPFWVVPLDGSPAFIPQTPAGEEPMNLPRPFGSLWASDLQQLVGNVDTGPAGFGGVWVYQFSADLTQIESYYRIGDTPQGDNSFINLVDWWRPGESILVLDGDNPDTSLYLSELWRGPAVWSLINKQWGDYPDE
ncbi:MAG: hypothetical protein WBG94_06425 [Anaerolineales bacterium]